MPYIGKSPQFGVRSRFYYTQSSAGGTSVSGTDDNGKTLKFSDGEFVDVMLNGVTLVAGTDYNTSTTNTIAGLAALSNGDVVEVVVYDTFSVSDTVSAKDGGTFSGAVIANGGLSVGTIKEVTGTTTAMTIDSSGRILTPARPAFSGIHINAGGNTGLTGTIIMNTEDFDIGGNYNNTTGIYTVPVTGIYRYSFSGIACNSTGFPITGQHTVGLQTDASGSFVFYHGMTAYIMETGTSDNTGSYMPLPVDGLISAKAGNQLKIQTLTSSTYIFATTTAYPAYAPRFSIELVG